jgi:hypothetical protein
MNNEYSTICPKCKQDSIIGIHAGASCGRRVLLHNYRCCRCGYDTGNFIDIDEALKELEDSQNNVKEIQK